MGAHSGQFSRRDQPDSAVGPCDDDGPPADVGQISGSPAVIHNRRLGLDLARVATALQLALDRNGAWVPDEEGMPRHGIGPDVRSSDRGMAV